MNLYPLKTYGSEIARKARKECNKLSAKERKILFDKGIKIIYHKLK